MKCPACKGPLREMGAGGMTLNVCYGGCGGIWFDPTELDHVDARVATTLHTVWQSPHKKVVLTVPRLCPRCPDQVLDRRWFSAAEKVEAGFHARMSMPGRNPCPPQNLSLAPTTHDGLHA